MRLVRGLRGRSPRGRAALKERLEYLQKQDPTGWDWTASRPGPPRWLYAVLSVLYDTEAIVINVPGFYAVVDRQGPSPVDGMIPWLWREQRRGAWATTHSPRGLRQVRDWFVGARPNLFRHTYDQAVQAAEAWETTQEVKRTRRALKQALPAFSVEVLRGPTGVWRLRPPGSSPLAPVRAIGKMLGHCYAQDYHARLYAEENALVVLFGRDGWPQAAASFTRDAPERLYEATERQNALILPGSATASALISLLRKTLGPPSPHWRMGLLALEEISPDLLVRMWMADDSVVDEFAGVGTRTGAQARRLLEWVDEAMETRQYEDVEWSVRVEKGDDEAVLSITGTQRLAHFDEWEADHRARAWSEAAQESEDYEAIAAGDDPQDLLVGAVEHFRAPYREAGLSFGVDEDDLTVTARIDLREALVGGVAGEEDREELRDKMRESLGAWWEHRPVAWTRAIERALAWGYQEYVRGDKAAAARLWARGAEGRPNHRRASRARRR